MEGGELMATEMKIDREQFDALTGLLETVTGRLDDIASYLDRIISHTAQTIDAVRPSRGLSSTARPPTE
jgi:hypothetical protein